ncbi:SRPBCC family protein [Streptacidiphilus cavernicola]|uniref:SRPBCC family protein n=1 Tax=Streptacidiphilus cavernicola TaxID=3342716 RepID=A0ABV6W598_9ACTN
MPKRRRLRPVTDGFLEQAPVRIVVAARLRAQPGEVFRELTEDASTWPLWFRSVRTAGYTGPPPYGTGAGRAVTLRGGVHFVESVVGWEPPHRFVYRVEQTNLPGVQAWMEEWLTYPAEGGGTDLRFTMAIDAPPTVHAAVWPARPGIARSVRAAVARLDARCAGTA